ncbi:tRNA-dihydrouridine synthase family protein [Candidatus Binatia bacterium]|jgi:nifR3 family TIM-barrel protein|nr:tRNA-dihydrouridine synthase family protein [Candidatus Binatia bacterium]
MVGLSHVALRQTVASYLPHGSETLLFTEMLSSRRLPTERIGDRPETTFAEHERLVPQLLANEERFIAASLDKLAKMRPAAIDINMGCPVSKALKHNWGVALMGDPSYAEEVVRLTVKHSPWPVSVKLRTGLSDDPDYLVDFARMLESAGAAWLTIHPRIASQQRRGNPRWEYIARVRDAVRIPVVGNGDVQTAADAIALLRATGCDGVMIGRASVARPWIHWQIAEALGLPPPPGREGAAAPSDGFAEGAEYARALGCFLDVCERSFQPDDALKRLKFFVHWGGRWLDFGHELWRRMTNVRSLDDARTITREFFAVPQRMTARTTLAA